ncbi:hypothetical protein BST36_26985 [Mycolicibacterium moriokaense]|uniref:DUF4352 domain-containing protein n=1 Tax=Mycolicibacterium moriokaense TaxID=39691 RepID=UPI0009F46CEB|nr:DUF4352 domain-containing protein [Mycolicibacterium moriokaense]ORB15704.1 hypothetical protein BST36_26985 [Mycolicibacterium moriokaense]
MTTPPTPAGWYPDPDGSGGQRYWDGSSWTEHRYPAAPPPPTPPPPTPTPPPAAPAEPAASEQPTAVVNLPPEPASDEPAASEQPTAIVNLPPAPAEERVGAHRKPDPENEPAASPESFTQRTDPVSQRIAPDVPPSTPPPSGPPPTFGAPPTDSPAAPRQSDPYPSAPTFGEYAPEAPPPSRNRGLAVWYGIGVAVLLVILAGVAIYGFVIKDQPEIEISSPGTSTEESPTSTETSTPSETPTETPTAEPTTVGPTGDVVDGPLSFTVHGIEVGETVVMSDAPLEKTAVGEFIVVHMTVTNVGTDPATFIGSFQTLHAGGTTFALDDEATAYLEGTFADLAPGASADVSLAFDVPQGTPAETIELHADPTTPGAEVPLS